MSKIGALFVFPSKVSVSLEWLAVDEHPTHPGLILLVPVDEVNRAGTADRRLGGKTARCKQSVWVFATELKYETGRVAKSIVRQVLEKLAAIETEDDPSYNNYMNLVKEAREELA